jgi:hypothetical protein
VKVAKTVKNLPTFGSFRKVRYYLIIPKSGDGHQCTDYLPLTKERYYLEAFISSKGLYAEYQYFKENAREVYEEGLPFPVIKL